MTERQVRFDTVPAEARAFNGEPAGVVTRVMANAIDLAVAALMAITAYGCIAGLTFLRQGPDFRFPVVSYPAAYAAGALILIVYFTVCWTASGRTYGDRVLGLRVRTADDQDLSAARSFVRALLCTTFPFLLVWVAVDPHGRSGQDLITRTRVVYDWGGAPSDRRSDDASGVGVDVAPAVSDEPDHGHAEPLTRVDRER